MGRNAAASDQAGITPAGLGLARPCVFSPQLLGAGPWLQVSEELVKKKVKDPSDFEWLKQCRCAWRDDRDTVVVSICDIDFEYSYEYLGEASRLGCASLPCTESAGMGCLPWGRADEIPAVCAVEPACT